MMSVLEGIAYGISHTQVITGVSPALVNAVNHKVAGLPLGVIYGLVLAAIILYALEFRPLGRLPSFIGGSAEAAALLGLPVRRIRVPTISYRED
jgi:ribose/xylose/arabinose/galactoside ABC-type transport system permease subunit